MFKWIHPLVVYGFFVIGVTLFVLEGSMFTVDQPFAIFICMHENCDVSNLIGMSFGVGIPVAISIHLWNKARIADKRRLYFAHYDISVNLSNARNLALVIIKNYQKLGLEKRKKKVVGNINPDAINNMKSYKENIEKVMDRTSDLFDPVFGMQLNKILEVFRDFLERDNDQEKIRVLHLLDIFIEKQFEYEPLNKFNLIK